MSGGYRIVKEFKVGVFEYEGKRKKKYVAYTKWYNPQWKGCSEYIVIANNGTDAKKQAILKHKGLIK